MGITQAVQGCWRRDADFEPGKSPRSSGSKLRPEPRTLLGANIPQKKSKLTESYDVNELVKSECQGTHVYRAVCKHTGEARLLKERQLKGIEDQRIHSLIEKEFLIWKKMDHPHVIRCYEAFRDPNFLCIVLEDCSDGDLLNRVKHFPQEFIEPTVRVVFRQMMLGVRHIHERHVAHRDLKLENIALTLKGSMLMKHHVKISDFSLSREFDKAGTACFWSTVGSANYACPDMCRPPYCESCDIWSSGVILYALIMHRLPFQGSDAQETIRKVQQGTISFDSRRWDKCSNDVPEVICRMCEVERCKRATSEEVLKMSWVEELCDGASKRFGKRHIRQVGYSLKRFAEASKVKLQANVVMAHLMHEGLITEIKELQLWKDVFEELDKVGVGYIRAIEIQELVGDLISQEAIETVLGESGKLDIKEWIAVNLLSVMIPEHMCREAFNIFDKSGSGELSRRELQKMLEESAPTSSLTPRSLKDPHTGTFISSKELMSMYDVEGDGGMTFDEFVAMINGH